MRKERTKFSIPNFTKQRSERAREFVCTILTSSTSSSSEINVLFVLKKIALHALNSRVPPLCAGRNELGKVLLSDIEEVVWCLVLVINGIGANKVF